ncbi:Putative heterokaryon incompatibility [Septoria linicola]|uniref:Heterokaryon incompatibility n=1 Tax=Septoria linicola TaxID=215465 RepID=A0A9Q9AJC4_9PEZI|nr:Putative heterokaryon incompatibility [Septoria linicola]
MTDSLASKLDAIGKRKIANGLWELSPSRQNREAIFERAVTTISQSQEEAQLILSNLQRLSPNLAADFGLRTSDKIFETQFKAICESENESFPFAEDQPLRQFIAVSYSWRKADGSWPADGSVPHSPWPFSKPFVDAVLSERGVVEAEGRNPAFPRECVFIDAMCIDQTDEDEKQRNIDMMDIIYKSCRKLMILLEDVVFTDEEVAAVTRIDYEQIVPGFTHDIPEADSRHLISAWRKIEASRWWGRAWCWHEFEVNEPWDTLRCSYYVHCALFVVRHAEGTFKVKWLQLLWIRAMTGSDTSDTLTTKELQNATRWTIADNRTSRHGDVPFRREGSARSSVMARLSVINSTESSIPADIVSIVINLSGLALYYRGRPTSREEVIWIVTTLALAAGEKSALTLMNGEMLSIRGQESWLSQHAAEANLSVPTFVLGGNLGLHRITPHAIELDLLFFEHVVEWPRTDNLELADRVFPQSPIPTTPIRYRAGLPDSAQRTEDPSWEARRRGFLAHACESGLNFILRLWNQLQRQVVQESYDQGGLLPFEANELLRPNAYNLHELLTSGENSLEQTQEHLESLLLFLTWLTDPRSMYYVSAFCLRLPCGVDDFAFVSGIMLRNNAALELTKWRIAIPVDLTDTSCQAYRAWLLRPVEDNALQDEATGLWENKDGRYRIVGKMLLLGENVLEDNDFVRLRTRQIVTA